MLADRASGAQLVTLNRLGLLPETNEVSKDEASAILDQAVLDGAWIPPWATFRV